MMDTDRATEETKAEKYPPLEQADRERLYTLLCEAADMGIALDRLLATKNPEDCRVAWPELHRALDKRLSLAMGLVFSGKES